VQTLSYLIKTKARLRAYNHLVQAVRVPNGLTVLACWGCFEKCIQATFPGQGLKER